jgi:hypothetical protein
MADETDESTGNTTDATAAQEAKEPEAIPFKKFLEETPPSSPQKVTHLWYQEGSSSARLGTPELRLHCDSDECSGVRTFRCNDVNWFSTPNLDVFLTYVCSDCRKKAKRFSLRVTMSDIKGSGTSYKYGEAPAYGPQPHHVCLGYSKKRLIHSSKDAVAKAKVLVLVHSPTIGESWKTRRTEFLKRSSRYQKRSMRQPI